MKKKKLEQIYMCLNKFIHVYIIQKYVKCPFLHQLHAFLLRNAFFSTEPKC